MALCQYWKSTVKCYQKHKQFRDISQESSVSILSCTQFIHTLPRNVPLFTKTNSFTTLLLRISCQWSLCFFSDLSSSQIWREPITGRAHWSTWWQKWYPTSRNLSPTKSFSKRMRPKRCARVHFGRYNFLFKPAVLTTSSALKQIDKLTDKQWVPHTSRWFNGIWQF